MRRLVPFYANANHIRYMFYLSLFRRFLRQELMPSFVSPSPSPLYRLARNTVPLLLSGLGPVSSLISPIGVHVISSLGSLSVSVNHALRIFACARDTRGKYFDKDEG